MNSKIKESDLYLPIKQFFQIKGYTVKGEVKNCDIVCIKEKKVIVIEIKKTFNLKLVYQAIERQSLTSHVYVAILKPNKSFNDINKLCKRIGIGLIFVTLGKKESLVEIKLSPDDKLKNINYKKRSIMIKETINRKLDNVGGSNKTKIITAFREQNIKIACIIKNLGEASPKQLIVDYKFDKKVYSILNNNYYGWFYRKSRGKYTITDKCLTELESAEFRNIYYFYIEELNL